MLCMQFEWITCSISSELLCIKNNFNIHHEPHSGHGLKPHSGCFYCVPQLFSPWHLKTGMTVQRVNTSEWIKRCRVKAPMRSYRHHCLSGFQKARPSCWGEEVSLVCVGVYLYILTGFSEPTEQCMAQGALISHLTLQSTLCLNVKSDSTHTTITLQSMPPCRRECMCTDRFSRIWVSTWSEY